MDKANSRKNLRKVKFGYNGSIGYLHGFSTQGSSIHIETVAIVESEKGKIGLVPMAVGYASIEFVDLEDEEV